MKELSAKERTRLLSGTAREFLGLEATSKEPRNA